MYSTAVAYSSPFIHDPTSRIGFWLLRLRGVGIRNVFYITNSDDFCAQSGNGTDRLCTSESLRKRENNSVPSTNAVDSTA